MKKMNKSQAYTQVLNDITFASEQIELFANRIQEIGSISVGSTITIEPRSSDKQYVFAIGVLNSQINSSQELGLDPKPYMDMKELVINLRVVTKELQDWKTYLDELMCYKYDVYKLLSDDEKFKLLKYPQK
jgi:hypothetical protein